MELYCLVAGTRTFSNYDLLEQTLDSLINSCPFNECIVHIVSGAAKGADTLAAKYARTHGYELHEFYAEWHKYGYAAGPIRNKQMHEFIRPHKYRVCVCFWDGQSKGTKGNFELAEQYHTPLKVVRYC